ncbi:hypothetical protein [Streptomyces shenzhenensis]
MNAPSDTGAPATGCDPEQAEQVLDWLIARMAEETGSGPQS